MSFVSTLALPLDADKACTVAKRLLAQFQDERLDALTHHDAVNLDRMRALIEQASSWEELAEELVHGSPTMPALLAHVLAQMLGEQEPVLAAEGMSVEQPTIIAGSLYVEGPLEISNALWVLGDCVCEGVVRDEGPDSHVVVLGDLRTPGLITSGEFSVWGSIETLMLLCQHNESALVVAGNVEARIVYEDEHDVAIYGSLDAQLHASADMEDHERFALIASWIEPHHIIDPDNFEIDLEGLAEALNQGDDPILAAPRVVNFGDYD